MFHSNGRRYDELARTDCDLDSHRCARQQRSGHSARAQAEARLILTFDKDFGELAFRTRLPAASGIILCRLPGLPPARVVAIVLAALNSRPDWADRFTVIIEQRIRVITLPSA